jgi:hypothetical protein
VIRAKAKLLESKIATTLDWIRPVEGRLPLMAFRICPDLRSHPYVKAGHCGPQPNSALRDQVTLVVVSVGEGFG